MTLDPAAMEAIAAELGACLHRTETHDGQEVALARAAGLLMGATSALAEIKGSAIVAAVMVYLRESEPATRRAAADAVAFPVPDVITGTSHNVARSLRQVAAASGEAVALERIGAALLASTRCLRAITDGVTLVCVLQEYARKAENRVAADDRPCFRVLQ